MARAGIAVTRQMTLHFQYSLARFPTPAQLAHSSGAMRKIPRQTNYTRRTRPVAMLTIDTSEKKDVADHALLGSGILDRVGPLRFSQDLDPAEMRAQSLNAN